MSQLPGRFSQARQHIPSLVSNLRAALVTLALAPALLAAGCASQPKNLPIQSLGALETSSWTGRISLQIESEPPQAFFAGFSLKGKAEKGELTLTSPIGSTLGVMRWSPDEALLESGNAVKRFASVDALLRDTTGAAIPVAALFDWLDGKNTALNGWTADLSQRSAKKISAKRIDPAPQANLRIVLE